MGLRAVDNPVTWETSYSRTPQNMDTSLLRTVCFVPGENPSLHFLYVFKIGLDRTILILTSTFSAVKTALKRTHQLCGMAITLRMRTAISPARGSHGQLFRPC